MSFYTNKDNAVILNQNHLSHEVKVLHRQFFKSDAPKELIKNYIKCHSDMPEMTDAKDSEFRTVRIVIEKELDALGIEPWLRSGSTRHLLSRKILLISYLAECDALHLEFRKEVRGFFCCLVYLFRILASGGFHLSQGFLQKVIYGLL